MRERVLPLRSVSNAFRAHPGDDFGGRGGSLGEMSAHRTAAFLGIAFLKRRRDGEVFISRGGVNGESSGSDDLPHLLDDLPVACDLGCQPSIARGIGDRGVKGAVVLPAGIGLATLPDMAEPMHEIVEQVPLDSSGGQAGRLHLEEAADRVELSQFVRTKGMEDRAAVSTQLEKTESPHFQKRFADGGAAHAEPVGDLSLRDSITVLPLPGEQTGDQAANHIGLGG